MRAGCGPCLGQAIGGRHAHALLIPHPPLIPTRPRLHCRRAGAAGGGARGGGAGPPVPAPLPALPPAGARGGRHQPRPHGGLPRHPPGAGAVQPAAGSKAAGGRGRKAGRAGWGSPGAGLLPPCPAPAPLYASTPSPLRAAGVVAAIASPKGAPSSLPQVVAYNKMDVPDSSDYWEDVREGLAAEGVPPGSIFAIRRAPLAAGMLAPSACCWHAGTRCLLLLQAQAPCRKAHPAWARDPTARPPPSHPPRPACLPAVRSAGAA